MSSSTAPTVEAAAAETTTTDTAAPSTGDSTEATATETTEQESAPDDGEAALGDAGKKALDAMKAKWKAAEAESKKAADEVAALRAAAEGREAEHKAAMKQREAEAAALAKADERILKAEVRAAAAGKLADPQDALRFLDLSEFEVGSDGEVDGDAIAAAITDLTKTKPYLAVQDGKRFQGEADGGVRKEARPAQVAREELSRMTPDEINTARAEGRLSDLLGGS